MKYANFFFVIGVLFSGLVVGVDVDWAEMQETYRALVSSRDHHKEFYSKIVHADGNAKSRVLREYLLGDPVEDFLLHPVIKTSMVRKLNLTNPELEYILHHTNADTRKALLGFQETYIGGLSKSVHAINCSGNSLAAMYYLARAMDFYGGKINTIVEFGGGYGSLAALAKLTMPSITYVIIDLPEVCAIQSLYLKKIMPEVVKVHYEVPRSFEQGFIHLIPAYLLSQISLDEVDLFISTFAITESTLFAQQCIAQQVNFFNAASCYIIGLITSPKWVASQPLVNMTKHHYPVNNRGRYLGNNHIYEMCAKK